MSRPRAKGPEESFLSAVVDLARLRGWRAYHARPARTAKGWRTPTQGHAGFPDLVLARRGRVVVAELKCGKNRPTADQEAWLDELRAAGAVTVRVWTPEHWPEIEQTLA